MRPSADRSADPSTQRRLLCRDLRLARCAAGYTHQQAGDALGWVEAKVQRIEGGQVGLSPTDLRALLDLYGVRDRQVRCRLETMARQGRRLPGAQYRNVLSDLERRYLGWEGSASRIRQYAPFLVPELLRTDAYAWAVIEALAAPGTSVSLLRGRWEACLARQGILDRDGPPELSFVIDEAALRRPVGTSTAIGCGGAVMARQARRLLELAGRDAVTIDVLPLSAGPHRGLGSPFVILDFPDGEASRVYLPGRARPVLTAASEVAGYDQLYTDLRAIAAPTHLLHKILDQTLLDPTDPGIGRAPSLVEGTTK